MLDHPSRHSLWLRINPVKISDLEGEPTDHVIEKRWWERFHKDNLRHLSRFPDFFVFKRILSAVTWNQRLTDTSMNWTTIVFQISGKRISVDGERHQIQDSRTCYPRRAFNQKTTDGSLIPEPRCERDDGRELFLEEKAFLLKDLFPRRPSSLISSIFHWWEQPEKWTEISCDWC